MSVIDASSIASSAATRGRSMNVIDAAQAASLIIAEREGS